MIEVCPQVDFYISATVGLPNSLHVPDFHRSWVEQDLIKPTDFNFNLLQNPKWQRMDLLPKEYKEQIQDRYEKHMDWLKDKDPLTRASKGFQSALDWMWRRDMSDILDFFFKQTRRYDAIRNEDFVNVFPEWKELFDKYEKS
jgi:hypothetical protein